MPQVSPTASPAVGSIFVQAAAFDQFHRLRALGLEEVAACPASTRARGALARTEKSRTRFDAIARVRWHEKDTVLYLQAVTNRHEQVDRMRAARQRIESAEFQLVHGPRILSAREQARAIRREASAQWTDASAAVERATRQVMSIQDRLVQRLDAKGLDALIAYRTAFSGYIDELTQESRR